MTKTKTFYKQEVERNQFLKFPKWLFKPPYNQLSSHAKIMYTMLYNRLGLSLDNKWYDKSGKIFQYYKNETLSEELNCSEKTVIKTKKELAEAGLLSEERQGLSLPNRIYLHAPSVELLSTGQELQEVQSRTVKNTALDLQKVQTNQTEKNQTENNISSSSCINKGEGYTVQQLLKDFESGFGRLLSPFEIEDIQKYVTEESFQPELIREALKEGVYRGKPIWNYIKAILRNWKADHLLTVEQVRAKQEEQGLKVVGEVSEDFLAAMDFWKE